MKFKLKYPELETEIYYLTSEEGGRKSAVHSGYRGQFHYDGKCYDAGQEFINKDFCEPGETVKVFLQMLSPNNHIGKFFVGKAFEIREGVQIVGKGKVTMVICPDFYNDNIEKNLETILFEKMLNKSYEITDEIISNSEKYINFLKKCREIIFEYKNNGGTQQNAFESIFCLYNMYNDRNMENKKYFVEDILDIIVGFAGNKKC